MRAWSETFGLEHLSGRLTLYRDLRDREQGMYASIYQDTVEALEGVEREARGGRTEASK
jgi:hypothetical protein